MKKILLVSCSLVLCLALIVSLAPAKNVGTDRTTELRPTQSLPGGDRLPDYDMEGLNASASASTTFLVPGGFTFDAGPSCSAQGWTTYDITAQPAEYFHVDDFAGLGGGNFGRLVPIRNTKSLWCGARPDVSNLLLCGYLSLPGYGNSWNQAWCNKTCKVVSGNVSIDFIVTWDSEPGYDGTTIEYDNGCTGAFVATSVPASAGGHFDGAFADSTHSEVILAANHSGSLKVRFHVQSDGAWSDEDGLWDTDGAVIIDSLSVRDGTGLVLAVEDFEGESVGATSSNDWEACSDAGYGDFAALLPGVSGIVQQDPCFLNLSCMWTFYSNPGPDPAILFYGCGGFPLQRAMPKGNSRAQYLSNEIWSPQITLSGSGAVFDLAFDSYRDLPLDNLQFYVWHIRSFVGTCPGAWKDRNFVYFGGQKDWLVQSIQTFGDLVDTGATKIQVAFGAVDACGFWCGSVGTGACHSHAPLLDNVNVYRVDTGGPQWSVRDLDLFQDTFPNDGSVIGTGRIDQANDVIIAANPNIRPGDSSVVQVNDPVNGLATDTYTGYGKAVYMYIAVWPQNQPGKMGTQIEGTGGPAPIGGGGKRFPLVDSLTIGSTKWYCIRMDSVFTGALARTGAVKDRYCVDLNDTKFTGCDTICFFFCATSNGGAKSYWAGGTGTVATLALVTANPEEVQVLPGKGYKSGGDILYVDGMNFRGAQPFFDSAFQSLGLLGKVDRYDIRSPSSSVSNRPDSRIFNRLVQLIGCYRKIIWNTGDLTNTLGDGGTGAGGTTADKTKDYAMLVDFLNLHPNNCGVYLNGDDLAERWNVAGLAALTLKNYCQHTLASANARTTGYGITPLGVGTVGNCFAHVTGPDTLVVFGGCPLINDFDIMTPAGTAVSEMDYRANALSGAAVVGQKTLNSNAATAGLLVSGFSFHYIRDARPTGVPARVHHMNDILVWLSNTPITPTGVKPVTNVSSLSQNYPNPFNPQTTIAFTVKDQARVSLKIYNVAGQLVRTLADDVRTPGVTHTIEWNGRNDAGASVSSGVYFYKLVSKDFTQTKKMVLLK